jgi:outer membrane protein assembly factor BamB
MSFIGNDRGPDTAPRGRAGVRWWPALLILAGAGAWIAHVWLIRDAHRQEKVMTTAAVLVVGFVLLLLWAVIASRLPKRARWAILLVAIGGMALGGALFRYEGVTGDLVPIFQPRWRARPGAVGEGAGVARAASESSAAKPSSGDRARRAGAGDFPQFLGAERDGVVRGARLDRSRLSSPELLWRRPLGEGWGGFAIVGERAITQEQDGADEKIACYDLGTGAERWAWRVPARYDDPIGGVGPRATPTVSGSRVYALGATGVLTCLELETGAVVWSTNVVGAGASRQDLEWGVSSSPLVISNAVMVAPRGASGVSLMALRADTGGLLWLGRGSDAHYSSPRVESVDGIPQILTFTSSGASGHDLATGARLWEHPWRGGHPHVTDPRLVGTNRILITSGYGTGAHLVEAGRDESGAWKTPRIVWRSMRLKSKFANVLLAGDVAYGLDDGRLVCLDLADGERRWAGERYGHGQLLLVGDLILITTEGGDVAFVEANPGAFKEVARFRVFDDKTWNPPAFAGDVLVARNHREAAAYRFALQAP